MLNTQIPVETRENSDNSIVEQQLEESSLEKVKIAMLKKEKYNRIVFNNIKIFKKTEIL